jgi:two-component system, OmpR family, clock-associated histidine kinase SasA
VLQYFQNKNGIESNNYRPSTLQLLLFVDGRSPSKDSIGIDRICAYLKNLQAEYFFDLDIIEIHKEPHLAEHFKLVATPSLVKIAPLPKQTLAGSDIIDQLEKWWIKWKESAIVAEKELAAEHHNNSNGNGNNYSKSIATSTAEIALTEKIFQLQQQNEELLEQLRFKNRAIEMLAHDLRSPLTAAFMSVETLEISQTQENTPKNQRLKQQLFDQARKQFKIINSMVEELLQNDRGSKAKLQIQPHKLNLQSLSAETIAEYRDKIQQKSLNLKLDIPQDLPDIYGDKALIRQLLVNLLENALKYTPECGEILVAALHRTSQKIQISICNTGSSIPREKREQIFEGRFRLKRDENQEGYGLGLSVCRNIVLAHYGRIWVDSSPTYGICFHLTLPVYR